MIYLFVVIFVLVLAFGGVLLRGAPYVPTLDAQGRAALDLLGLESGQTLLELGSGDGKMLVLAAQAGLNVVGIELNPFLVIVSWLRTRCYRVFVFLLDRFMLKLDKRMQEVKRPLVSFAFRVPGRKAVAEKSGVFLYKY